MGTLAALLLVFLSTVIGWPLGSLINRLRKRTSTAPPASRRARWVAGIVSLLNLIFIVVIVISVGPQFVFGVPTIVVGALAIPILTGSADPSHAGDDCTGLERRLLVHPGPNPLFAHCPGSPYLHLVDQLLEFVRLAVF